MLHGATAALAILILAVTAYLAQGGLAQESEEVDRIRVTGHYENAVGTSDAASQGNITPQLIEARPLLRPAEVLEYVPGVIITQHKRGRQSQPVLPARLQRAGRRTPSASMAR